MAVMPGPRGTWGTHDGARNNRKQHRKTHCQYSLLIQWLMIRRQLMAQHDTEGVRTVKHIFAKCPK
jgi:hypothetical protein